MKWIYLTLIFIFCALAAKGQHNSLDQFIGIWEGNMQMFKNGNVRDSVRVEFRVEKMSDSIYSWVTEYYSKKYPMVKDYKMLLTHVPNAYILDEGNNLHLSTYGFGNKLYNVFETGGILLTSTLERLGSKLIFEVTSGKAEPKTHPEVGNFSVDHLQRVVYTRKQ